LLRIVRLFKIVNLLKNSASFKRLLQFINMNVGVQRILMIAGSIIFMVHLFACLYFLLSTFEDDDDNNWVVYSGIIDAEPSYQYIYSMYWALQTLTTVGYGDIPARSIFEKIFALVWMIIGVGFYSFTIGNLSSIFNSIDVKAAQLQLKLNVLADFAKRTKLSEEIQNRIKLFIENNYTEHSAMSEQRILLSEVPSSMRSDFVS